ncbi:hypothetical protein EBU95_20170, partial [bacterium]|nr:hypothetical protein [bacterium]
WTVLGNSIFSVGGYGIYWNGKVFMATGNGSSNTLAYSFDGIRWTGLGSTIFSTQGNSVAFNNLRANSIIFPQNLIVAGGTGNNTIMYSINGKNWLPTDNIFSTTCNGIAFSPNLYVAVGQGTNTVAYSDNGRRWNAVSGSTYIFSTSGNGVLWNGNMFVAVGTGSSNTISFSFDGYSWSYVGTAIFSTSGNDVCWYKDRFIAVGSGTNSIAYSFSGTTWVGIGTTIFLVGNKVSNSSSIVVATGQGNNTIGYSSNGINWTGIGSTIFKNAGFGILNYNNNWYAVGSNNVFVKACSSVGLRYSYDGINWFNVTWTNASETLTSGRSVRYANGYWVAGGVGNNNNINLFYSTDGINWTATSWRGFNYPSIASCGFVSYENGNWIAGGFADIATSNNPYAYISGNPTGTWTGYATGLFDNSSGRDGRKAVWVANSSVYVFTGNGSSIYYSSSLGGSLTGVTLSGMNYSVWSYYANGYVVIGGNGTTNFYYSSNGTTYTAGTSVFSGGFVWSSVYNNNVWVLCGSTSNQINHIAYSLSGNPTGAFTLVPLGFYNTLNYARSVNFFGNRFYVVGETSTSSSVIYTSLDGINWISFFTSSLNSIYDISVSVTGPSNVMIAGGQGTNTLSYSLNGSQWIGLGTTIFSTSCFCADYNRIN